MEEKPRPDAARSAKPAAPREPLPPKTPRRAQAPARSSPRALADLGSRLLAWYDRNRRDLPWRSSRDPYAIWVSEVMLQQTQVATVLRYFPDWMRRFPNVRALARAPEAEVLHAWQGLGYYSRARRLQAGARCVVERHAGELPRSHAGLLELPGIGAYSAGAIASIAFGEQKPLVDGNVVRVLARHFGLRGDPGKEPLRRALWRLAGELVPAKRPGDFNQALMELGATVCTPRTAACSECPLRASCVAKREALVATLPELPARPKPTRVRAVAVAVRDGARVVLAQLPASAPRWAGLWTFPHVELEANETTHAGAARAVRELLGVEARVGRELARIQHTITRFRIALELVEATLPAAALRAATRRPDVARALPSELERYAMPAPHRKLVAALAAHEEDS